MPCSVDRRQKEGDAVTARRDNVLLVHWHDLGRYPQSNGLVGLAHHGWEYRAGVRTLPHILSESGWYTALFGMQHETSYPSTLGFDEFDVSNSYCEYVVEHASRW